MRTCVYEDVCLSKIFVLGVLHVKARHVSGTCMSIRTRFRPAPIHSRRQRSIAPSSYSDMYCCLCIPQDPSGEVPKFLYGSHYSNLGIVLYFLVRMEPFTTLCQAIQGGRFDHADRMFHSVSEAWRNCTVNPSDVKELVPEFYTQPEMFVNRRKLQMGCRQGGEPLADVVLPPWAKGSPHLFVQTMVCDAEAVQAQTHASPAEKPRMSAALAISFSSNSTHSHTICLFARVHAP